MPWRQIYQHTQLLNKAVVQIKLKSNNCDDGDD